MANVFLVHGARGAGKTTTILRLADELECRGISVGGYFQRTTADELGRRGYDLVRIRDRAQTLPLARPPVVEKSGTNTLWSFSFSQAAFSAGLDWLKQDASSARVLVIDEISRLEVKGEGHAQALRWALDLDGAWLLLLGVREDQLAHMLEAFGLEERVAGQIEVPATPEDLAERVEHVIALLG